MTTPTSTEASDVSLLRSKRYVLFWISSLFSNLGTWMQQVAQPWIILSLNPSSVWVGIDSFALNAPGWMFTLWGGILADRMDRKKIILFFQSIQAVCVFLLLVLMLLGALKVWMIVVISFLIGTTDAFSTPALQSIIPSLVKPADIPRAVALNSTQFNLARVAGPALAGLMIATYGAVTCVSGNLLSYLPFFLSIYWIYPRNKPTVTSHDAPATSVQTGNQFLAVLKDDRFQNPLISVFVTGAFCSQLITFTSVLVRDLFHAGAVELGWSTASFGLGGVVGAVISSVTATGLSNRRKTPTLIAASLGLVIGLVAWSPSLVLFDSLLFLAGLTLTISNTSVNSLLQMSASDHMRGKVASMFQLAMRGGISAGSLVTGTLISQVGVKRAFLINGVCALVLQSAIFARLLVKPLSGEPNSRFD